MCDDVNWMCDGVLDVMCDGVCDDGGDVCGGGWWWVCGCCCGVLDV